jgi:uroporphyrinogen-III synthase
MRVVVTRPLPQADQTAAKLRALGHEPVVLPLTEIVPLRPAIPAVDLAACDIVAATSANAFVHLPAEYARILRDKPASVVGDATERAALMAGFSDVESAGGDASNLAALIADNAVPGGTIAYLCGRVRKPDFEREMAHAGFAIVGCETYDTLAIAYRPDTVRAALAAAGTAVLLYSANAAQRLADLTGNDVAQGTLFCCLSPRIGHILKAAGHSNVRIARNPDEAGLLDCLGADQQSA